MHSATISVRVDTDITCFFYGLAPFFSHKLESASPDSDSLDPPAPVIQVSAGARRFLPEDALDAGSVAESPLLGRVDLGDDRRWIWYRAGEDNPEASVSLKKFPESLMIFAVIIIDLKSDLFRRNIDIDQYLQNIGVVGARGFPGGWNPLSYIRSCLGLA
jgi:hypothetical protein